LMLRIHEAAPDEQHGVELEKRAHRRSPLMGV